MRQIKKSTEPASLTQHRLKPHANYDNYEAKADLRQSLSGEQFKLCCYCSGRISPEADKMKIEHFSCQTAHPELQLVYSNLLAACIGGQGQAQRDQHCDTRKGSSPLTRNPASSSNIDNFLTFLGDGTIQSTDATFDRELNEVLNLNHPTLKQNRKSTLDSFLDSLSKLYKGTLTREQWESHLKKFDGSNSSSELTPYAPMIAFYIRKKLRATA